MKQVDQTVEKWLWKADWCHKNKISPYLETNWNRAETAWLDHINPQPKKEIGLGDEVWVLYSPTKDPETGVLPPVKAVIIGDSGYYYNVTTVVDNLFISTVEKKLTFLTEGQANTVYGYLSMLVREKKIIEQDIYNLIHK